MSTLFHDLGQILVKMGTNSFTDFAGDGILWAPIEDRIAKLQGARGLVVVSAMFDELSETTLNIMPGSPNMAIIDLMMGVGGARPFAAFSAVDPLGNTDVFAPACALRRRPDWAKPVEAVPLVAVFDLFNATLSYGAGAVQVG